DLRHLESLDVSGNHLQELPDSLLKLTDLLKLHATGNDLTAVPDLGPLTKLLDLDLSMNQIPDQPEWLDKLTSLKTLDLSRNLIDGRLTSAVCALAELETLKLRRNLLDGLPDCMGDLISLDDLDLAYNELVDALPETWGLAKWHRLYHLHVSDNKLKTLPASFSAALIVLRSENNKLSEYPPMLTTQRAVTTIFLRNNKITSLPTTFGPRVNESSSATMELDLAYNRIETVSEAIGELEYLRKLDLQYNSIRTISEDIAYARSIEKLKLAGNQLLDLPEGVGRKR
ncbi:hypothetical protein AURANDRAFT_13086, partial [Aureococcus anophagefferens]